MRWDAFAAAAPQLAGTTEEAFDRKAMVMLGTLRRDGWPRISPVEHMFLEGELLLGMLWRSRKALDLLRDARCVVHAIVANPDGRTDPEIKVYGRVRDVVDSSLRLAYGDAWWARSQWRPSEPYHLFALDIESVGYIRFDEGEQQRVETWPHGGVRVIDRRG